MPYDLIPVTGQPGLAFPALFAPDAGTARRVIEFFTANIRNPHTRKAYAKAAGEFAVWVVCSNGTKTYAKRQPTLHQLVANR